MFVYGKDNWFGMGALDARNPIGKLTPQTVKAATTPKSSIVIPATLNPPKRTFSNAGFLGASAPAPTMPTPSSALSKAQALLAKHPEMDAVKQMFASAPTLDPALQNANKTKELETVAKRYLLGKQAEAAAAAAAPAPAPAPYVPTPPLTTATTSAPLSTGSGGGGGGGGGYDQQDATLPDAPPPSWWESLGTVPKVAIVGGGLAVVGLVGYKLMTRGGRSARPFKS